MTWSSHCNTQTWGGGAHERRSTAGSFLQRRTHGAQPPCPLPVSFIDVCPGPPGSARARTLQLPSACAVAPPSASVRCSWRRAPVTVSVIGLSPAPGPGPPPPCCLCRRLARGRAGETARPPTSPSVWASPAAWTWRPRPELRALGKVFRTEWRAQAGGASSGARRPLRRWARVRSRRLHGALRGWRVKMEMRSVSLLGAFFFFLNIFLQPLLVWLRG